jgi:hypothetical protein
LHHADVVAAKNPTASKWDYSMQKMEELRNHPEPAQKLGAAPLVDGDMLNAMGFLEGPAYKHVLDQTRNAQYEGKLTRTEPLFEGDEQSGRVFVQKNYGDLIGLPTKDQAKFLPKKAPKE